MVIRNHFFFFLSFQSERCVVAVGSLLGVLTADAGTGCWWEWAAPSKTASCLERFEPGPGHCLLVTTLQTSLLSGDVSKQTSVVGHRKGYSFRLCGNPTIWSAFRRLRQEDDRFEASRAAMIRHCLK